MELLKNITKLQMIISQSKIKKAVLKRTADCLEKLGIAGMAAAVFQNKTEGIYWGSLFLISSYICTIMEAKNERMDRICDSRAYS